MHFLQKQSDYFSNDPRMIKDPARIASELRNLSVRPDPGRAGQIKKIRPEPGTARIRPGPVDTSTR